MADLDDEKGQQERDGFLRENNDTDDDDEERRCGVGSCRPDSMQKCANMKAFAMTLAFLNLFGSINFSYYTAVITQIERRFGFSSSMVGFLKNVDNIGNMACVLLVSHFCRYANKPRLFTAATILTAGAVFLFSVPHYIFGAGDSISDDAISINDTKPPGVDMCDAITNDDIAGACQGRSILRSFNAVAFGIFIASELLQGVAQSPKMSLGMTYMDDNAKDSSPKFFGIMFGMRAFAPMLGFLIGAWTNSLYVDLSETSLTQKDPRWVGAWWLGFVISAGCTVVWCAPLILFPPVLPGAEAPKNTISKIHKTETQQESKKEKKKESKRDKMPTVKEYIKDLPKALFRLATNPVWMTIMIGTCFDVYIMGFASFLPKYLENYFNQTASIASILAGVLASLAFAVGPMISGKITSRMKITPFKALRLAIIIKAFAIAGYVVLMLVDCPDNTWVGIPGSDVSYLNQTECSSNCTCNPEAFEPVCGSNGLSYTSPCQAGCTDKMIEINSTATIYTGCSCIPGGTATSGECPRDCPLVYLYVVIMFLTKFVSSMPIVPMMTTLMRCVEERDKAISLAGVSFLLNIAAFPAPLVFGFAIDSACLLQQSTCGKKGACLVYDLANFRVKLHGFALVVKSLGFFFHFIGTIFCYRREKQQEKKEKELENQNQDMPMLASTAT